MHFLFPIVLFLFNTSLKALTKTTDLHVAKSIITHLSHLPPSLSVFSTIIFIFLEIVSSNDFLDTTLSWFSYFASCFFMVSLTSPKNLTLDLHLSSLLLFTFIPFGIIFIPVLKSIPTLKTLFLSLILNCYLNSVLYIQQVNLVSTFDV